MLCPRKEATMQCNDVMRERCATTSWRADPPNTLIPRADSMRMMMMHTTDETFNRISIEKCHGSSRFFPFEVHQMFSHFNAHTHKRTHTTPQLIFISFCIPKITGGQSFRLYFFCFVVFIYFRFRLVANKQQRKKNSIRRMQRGREKKKANTYSINNQVAPVNLCWRYVAYRHA